MTSDLMQDDLGEAGERLFAHLCSLVPFYCNKSERDRTGWDYVVETRMPHSGSGRSLDQREPTAAVVQVKATTRSEAVSARLSSVEYLAKDPRPAFITVFRLRPNGEAVAGYLIHLIGPVLRRVLRRLRIAEAKGELAVNRTTITFDHRRIGRRFEPTPDGLRSAVLEACGESPRSYVFEKQRQLDELGYEDGRLEAEAVFRIESADHLTNVLMGIEPLRPERFRAFDTRFGIRIPYTGSAFDQLEELMIEPPSLGPCQVTIRGPGLSVPAVFEADMGVGPPLGSDDGIWLIVKHDDLNLTFRSSGLSFETIGNFDTKPRTLAAWLPLGRALCYLADGQGTVGLTAAFNSALKFDLPINDKLTGPHLENLGALRTFLEAWRHLIDLAGVTSESAFSFAELSDARDAHLATDVMFGHGSRTWFAFDAETIGAPNEAVEALYFNTCSLADAAVTFAVRVTLAPNPNKPGEFASTGFTPLDARPAITDDLQDYGEEIAESASIQILINPALLIEASER